MPTPRPTTPKQSATATATATTATAATTTATTAAKTANTNTTTAATTATKTKTKAKGRALSLERWHKRLGHLNYADVKQLATYSSQIKLANTKESFCEPCVYGKQHAITNHEPQSRAGALFPRNFLGAGRVDPFQTYPAKGQRIDFLIDFCKPNPTNHTLPKRDSCSGTSANPNPQMFQA